MPDSVGEESMACEEVPRIISVHVRVSNTAGFSKVNNFALVKTACGNANTKQNTLIFEVHSTALPTPDPHTIPIVNSGAFGGMSAPFSRIAAR